MKKLATILSVAGVLAVGTAGWAQEPVPTEDLEVRTTTETTTGYANPDVMPMEETTYATMPATGGAPIAMALLGTLTAAGAYFTRRKLG